MAILSDQEVQRQLKDLEGLDARGPRDPETVHVQRFSRGRGVRQPAGPRCRGRGSPSRYRHQLSQGHAALQHARAKAASRRRTSTAPRWPIARRLDETRAARGDGPPRLNMRPDLKKNYSSREVASITGLSARQLQWWDARKLIKPSVASHRTEAGGFTERRYSPVDLFELAVLADLRRNGLSVTKMRVLVETLRKTVRHPTVRCHRRRRGDHTSDRRQRRLRAHRERAVLQSLARAGPAAAGRGKRRHVEGAEITNCDRKHAARRKSADRKTRRIRFSEVR